MAYELWTSPITGYRRTGTRLAELRSLIESGISARAILEPLQSCPADVSAVEAKRMLQEHDFDLAGVKQQPSESVIHWVATASLTHGHVRDHMKVITPDQLISDATPLPAVLKVLKERPHTFVLIGQVVAGILTRADLNKPPVRIYLFSLISLLEMHLSFWVQAKYPNDSWQEKLARKRVAEAKKIQKERHKHNQNPFLVECLQFCDKRDLVAADTKLRTELSLGSKERAVRFLRQAETLRNVLAHSQRDLVDGSSWEQTIAMIEWSENVIQVSDRRVEHVASTSAARAKKDPWASA